MDLGIRWYGYGNGKAIDTAMVKWTWIWFTLGFVNVGSLLMLLFFEGRKVMVVSCESKLLSSPGASSPVAEQIDRELTYI